ncbi:MAG TPA: ABC transporter ATP-binding protein [Tepidisphaeraceae bacterium]|jgi:iron complex transport system ATP-binding protein
MTLLAARDIHFSYSTTPILGGIDLHLNAGEIVALIGPNGSGKSTLIKLLLGHLTGSGDLRWDGQPIASLPRRDLARRVAYLPQSPTWDIEHRVADVLRLGRAPYWSAFGIETTTDARVVLEVAQQLNLTDLLHRRLDELSGGQRQRVFLGRCLVQQPAALLLDEPNTFLDVKHQVDLARLLRKLAVDNNVAILIASHDLILAAATAHRLILLHQGKVLAQGPAPDVLKPDILSAAYGVPMQRLDHAPGAAPVVVPVLDQDFT